MSLIKRIRKTLGISCGLKFKTNCEIIGEDEDSFTVRSDQIISILRGKDVVYLFELPINIDPDDTLREHIF